MRPIVSQPPARPPGPPLARFAAAEARLHRSAAALERASLDAVDAAARVVGATPADRVGDAVAAVIRRCREARHAP